MTAFAGIAVLLSAASISAQEPAAPQKTAAEQEQADLSTAVGEAGNSAVDFTRALERHLSKYPQSAQRSVLEKALAKAAVDANDRTRIILYGERVLQADPNNDDLALIDRVTRTLLDDDDAEKARRALPYAKRYEAEVALMRSRAADGHINQWQWEEDADKAKARALVLEARAVGNMGNSADALQVAKTAWQSWPGSEAAREVARWLARLDRNAEAVEYYANAFTIDDGHSADADRARDRVHMGELYAKLNTSEKGLGDTVLRAYDRMASLKKDRLAKNRLKDPNAGATELNEFIIPNVDGTASLAIASLKGKAVVLDFWATWCGPCRAQHPMIENVKKQFDKSGDVVFLSIDSDEDHSVVPAFVKEMNWNHSVYYDGGLNNLLKISSIPTIIVLDTEGKISSRMAGFIPERFEDMLAQRITDARTETHKN